MQRRRFLAVLGGGALISGARGVRALTAKRIGVLLTYIEGDSEGQARIDAFRAGMQALGWTEGGNVQITYRWASTDPDRIRRFAKELVDLQLDLIITQNTPATMAVLDNTRSVPVIFFQASDPVGSGLVTSLPRPGGNVTGFVDIEGSLAGKWVELLKEIAPRVSGAAFLFNPATATYADYYLSRFKAAAQSLGVEAVEAPVRDKAEIASVIAAHGRSQTSGLIVMPEASMGLHREEIVAQAAHHSLPAIYPYRYFAGLGGLLSYGIDLIDQYRRAPTYADRILRGEVPSNLPVQQPTKFELLINLKTARALGLDVSPTLLARADEVIE